MARFTVNGLDALSDDLASLANIPDSVIEEVLNVEADIIAEEQRKTAREMLHGKGYDTGTTAQSIKKTEVKRTKNGMKISVYPQGTNAQGNRNAEVAFINEYGKGKEGGKNYQKPRQFIRIANERAGDRAVQKGEEVFNAYLDSKNL